MSCATSGSVQETDLGHTVQLDCLTVGQRTFPSPSDHLQVRDNRKELVQASLFACLAAKRCKLELRSEFKLSGSDLTVFALFAWDAPC